MRWLDKLSVKKIKQGKKMKFKHNNNTYELLFLAVTGSHLYGNSRPESDWDYRGVFVASNDTFLGLLGTVDQLEGRDVFNSLVEAGLELNDTDDVVLYELNRFCQLSLDNNPNMMDLLCHDYKNPKYSLYCSTRGTKLLENKHLFMSTKLRHTFSGYAMSQLKRVQGHNKWLTQFPHTDDVLRTLTTLFKNEQVDFDWLSDNFGGEVAVKVTGETAQSHKTLEKTVDYDYLLSSLNQPGYSLNQYRLPRLVDYMKAYDLTHRELDMNTFFVSGEGKMSKQKLKDFLNTNASFRKFGESTLSVYTDGNGVFGKEGNLKSNDSENLGEFVCLLSVNHNQYKADKDHVNKMWHWKCNRNEKRGLLEEKFGYDTKHASHLVRLMEGCKDVLETCVYEPTLSGDRLQLVNDVRNGKWSYEDLVKYAEKLDNELNDYYNRSTLKSKPNVKEVNKLVLELRNGNRV